MWDISLSKKVKFHNKNMCELLAHFNGAEMWTDSKSCFNKYSEMKYLRFLTDLKQEHNYGIIVLYPTCQQAEVI